MKRHYLVFFTIFLLLIGFNLCYTIHKLFMGGYPMNSVVLNFVMMNLLAMGLNDTISSYNRKVLKIKIKDSKPLTILYATFTIFFIILTALFFTIEFGLVR